MKRPAHYSRDFFFVCVEGSDAIGPVSAEQIARGIVAGKVPRDAHAAREGDAEWRDILDTPEIVGALRSL